MTDKERLFNSGILVESRPGAEEPPLSLWETKKNGLVVIECPQRIPCNPCASSCPTGAIIPFDDINDTPRIDYEKCIGCAKCVAICPGLACFVIDLTAGGEGKAVIKLPHEMLPRPEKGEAVSCLNRQGEAVAGGTVVAVTEPLKDRTVVVHVEVPRALMRDIRAVKVVKK